jgi:catechol 2,3-dioxygenase-like lactoylglutathione lyase family enzyme
MTSLFPVVCTDVPAACRDFYLALLDMKVVFENDWYVQLQHPEDARIQIAFVARGHASVPEGYRDLPRGVLVTFEGDDVDAIHARASELRLPLVLSLRDEDWGQRHFITRDPSGLLVDIVQMIAPTAAYAESYA